MSESTPALELRNISYSYEGFQVLSGITFSQQVGECVAIIGRSGCGKTTLLKIIKGLIREVKGDIYYCGKHMPEGCGQIGFQYQDSLLLDWFSVKTNLSIPLRIKGQKDRIGEIPDLLKMAGLEGCSDMYPGSLSGGMRRRVAFLRAYLQNPDFLILDEPFTGLDRENSRKLQEWVWNIRQEKNLTLILVTHDYEEAVLCADRILIMDGDPSKISDSINVRDSYSGSDFKEKIYHPEVRELMLTLDKFFLSN